jgi:hypothetical protein
MGKGGAVFCWPGPRPPQPLASVPPLKSRFISLLGATQAGLSLAFGLDEGRKFLALLMAHWRLRLALICLAVGAYLPIGLGSLSKSPSAKTKISGRPMDNYN